MDDTELWTARTDLELVELDGAYSLFDPARGTAIFLNQTASDVLALADGATDITTMSTVLAKAYGRPVAEIIDDVRSAVRDLASASALRKPTG